ncbi:MAG: PKD domain-containing protein, partial [Pseudomonadota bacterium]
MNYPVHVADWNAGDPTWGPNDKGKGIIGAVNYMAQTHGNSMYMVTFNTDGGDGCDVWPWTTFEERYRFDVSKLDQWEVVFQHLQHKGLQLHIVLAERENRTALENTLGLQRKLYYRELVARFAHNPVLQWNIGEEHNISNTRRRDYAQYIHDVDPYDHSVAIHSTATDPMDFYISGSGGGDPIIGAPMYEVSSIQGAISEYNAYPIILREATANAGRPWAIYADEQTIDAPPGVDKEVFRHTHGTWGHYLGGGAGVEWFLSADLTLEDFSADEDNRLITQHAVDFLHNYLPFWEMEPDNSLTTDTESFVFHKPGEVYAVSLPEGGTTDLNLTGFPGTYTVQWYDPWNGGDLQEGTITSIGGDGIANIGLPPHTANEQWVALITFFQANEAPVASFTAVESYLLVDLDATTSTDDGTIVSWDWDLGDGNTGTGELTSHTYLAPGTYTIQLTVTDDLGASSTESQSVTVIENPLPIAGFTFSTTDLAATFTDTSTDDGTIALWSWDFGDGNTSTDQNPVHVYAAGGNYSVSLTVTDNAGATNTVIQDVSVTEPNEDPLAVFTFSTTELTATFTDASTDDGTIASWSWEFGDGNTSTDQNPVHTYAAGGTYTVDLTVTDNLGATDTTSQGVTVTAPNGDPVAGFTFATTDLSADFTDTSTDDGTIASWSWDFGDTNTSTDQNPVHAYAAAGTYTVNLTVTDDLGATNTTSQDVTVTAPNGDPVAGFTFT